jgi:GNAT superfamily N-acetyltransferase
MSSPRYRTLSPTALAAIEDPCGSCGYGFAGAARNGSRKPPDDNHDGRGNGAKRVDAAVTLPDWVDEVEDLWGLCGMAVHVNGAVPGFLTVAPAELVPFTALPGPGGSSADAFSPDAAVVMAVAVCRDYRGEGLARNLVRAALAQLTKREVGMVEVIGTYGLPGVPHTDGAAASMVLLPVSFWQALGFRIVRPHPFTPTLRLDIESTARWRPDFAAAWNRFAELVTQPGPAQPASFQPHRDLVVRELTHVS